MSTIPTIGRVMVVADEEVDQYLHKRVLTRSGLVGNIIMFTYPDEALEYLKSAEREPIVDVDKVQSIAKLFGKFSP